MSIFWSTLEPCDILFLCRRPCLAHPPRHQPQSTHYLRRGGWACRQTSSPVLSVTSYLESHLHTHSNYLIWWETVVPPLLLLLLLLWLQSLASPALAGRCRASLPLIITAGDTWLIIAPCCCNRDRPGYQGDWEEQTLPEKKDMEERTNKGSGRQLIRLWKTSDILQNTIWSRKCDFYDHFNVYTPHFGFILFLMNLPFFTWIFQVFKNIFWFFSTRYKNMFSPWILITQCEMQCVK